MASAQELKRYRRHLADELDSAAVYDTLAHAEQDSERSRIFAELAASEREHARVWLEKLAANGVHPPPHRRSAKTRLLQTLTRLFGASIVLPTVAATEYADRDRYAHEPGAEKLSAQEQQHAATIQAIVASKAVRGKSKGEQIAAAESWHKGATSGNDLRAAVLGANDGLVSNFCLIMGVAGAGSSNRTILLTGLAGLVAGACSMALGEWLSVQNARELYQQQIASERDELERMPDEEAEELVLIYRAKGLDEARARALAESIMRDQTLALDTLVREELGLDPEDLGGSAWLAAITSFVVFCLGALIPVLPFLFLDGQPAVLACALLSSVGLFLIGALVTLFTGRNLLHSGLRQVAFGLGAAAITYGLGYWLGVSVAG